MLWEEQGFEISVIPQFRKWLHLSRLQLAAGDFLGPARLPVASRPGTDCGAGPGWAGASWHLLGYCGLALPGSALSALPAFISLVAPARSCSSAFSRWAVASPFQPSSAALCPFPPFPARFWAPVSLAASLPLLHPWRHRPTEISFWTRQCPGGAASQQETPGGETWGFLDNSPLSEPAGLWLLLPILPDCDHARFWVKRATLCSGSSKKSACKGGSGCGERGVTVSSRRADCFNLVLLATWRLAGRGFLSPTPRLLPGGWGSS